MFRGTKPANQPRTVRSIVEGENSAKNFPPPGPLPEQNWAREYTDKAYEARFSGARVAGPTPFKRTR